MMKYKLAIMYMTGLIISAIGIGMLFESIAGAVSIVGFGILMAAMISYLNNN